MKELQDLKGVGFMDVQFLLNAVTTVISVRFPFISLAVFSAFTI
jgi:hypothetical protein